MKKLHTLSVLLILAANTLIAQESIFGEAASFLSPDLSSDGRVTLRLRAPEARNVYLTGNLLRQFKDTLSDGRIVGKERMIMSKNHDVWTITLDSVKPDFYTYKFIVDGVETIDPNNSFVARDVNNVSSVVIVPGNKSAYYLTRNVSHGTLQNIWYRSGFNNLERRMSVYLPAGYAESDKEYPVLYLLHGMGGDETSWTELGRLVEIMDNMISENKIQPMIVVMPNGNLAREAAPGYDSRGLSQPEFNLPFTMDGQFESNFPEIIDYVDRHYRVQRDPEFRAIAGLSMGGLHALYTSLEYPEKFGYVGLFSAATDPSSYNPEGLPEIYQDRATKLKRLWKTARPLIYVAVGKDDFIFAHSEEIRDELDALRVPYVYNESDGGHEWSNWRHYLMDFLPRLFLPVSQ